ncbi:cellulase family glycosylhydrolase [Mycolicibacterium arenosum]|uniref:Cellulase family glycosylhydrolase n=1 Tax=Mycolicibacterium arenosum TaxID=2952157 RepID=A0ABT1M448_9MYCO|nr:cellulase family glycosylhydrolase [Mycolicibacterium sp. CAU 1645]MCP9272607.1 cellulase family glycosylhydrolase [Mycolicibacterium sp. CAU 1645]
MKRAKRNRGLVRELATRSVIAALPVAMVAAYASNLFVPPPPRNTLDYQMVAEINVSPSTVGIAASPLYGQSYESVKQQLQDMKDIGVTNVRVFVPWATIEFFGPYDPGSWPGTQLWADIDNIMRAAQELDMGVLAEINSTPPHAVIDGPIGSGTPDPAKFAAFLQKFIGEYGDVVSAYEVWNEPNYAAFSSPIDPEAYASLLAAAAKVIRQYDASASVVAGAVGTVQDSFVTMNTLTWVNRMLAQLETLAAADPEWDLDDYFDALSIHPYGEEIPFSGTCPTCVPGLLTPREQFEALTALAALQGKKIWITEYGLPTTPGGTWTETDQAEWVKDLLDTWQAYGDPDSDFYDPAIAAMLGPIFLYTGRDTPGMSGVDNPHDYYGLWKQNADGSWSLKEAGEMLRDWLDAINNPEEPEEPTVDPIAQFFQALAQQLAQALAQAIANWLASLAQPPAPTTTALRTATVEAPEDVALAVEAEVTDEATVEGETSEPTPADTAAAETEAVTEAPTEVVAEVPVETPVETAPETAPVEEPSAEETPAEETTPTDTTPTDTDSTDPTPDASTDVSGGGTGTGTEPGSEPKPSDTGTKDGDAASDKPDTSEKKADKGADAAKPDGDKARHGKSRDRGAATRADTGKPALARVTAGADSSDSDSSGSEE